MKISKFEDLEIWIEARKLVNMIYTLTDKSPFKKDFGLKEQIQRAAVSCMANIAEGFDSGSNQYFIQYLQYVRRSSSEVKSELYIALDRKYITEIEFKEIYEQAEKVGKLANGFIRYLKINKRANEQTSKRANQRGFTYTEVLITLAVMAALFVPMMQLFSHGLVSSAATGQAITALNLAKWQMERLKNLNYTINQLKEIGDIYFQPINEPPLELNGQINVNKRTNCS